MIILQPLPSEVNATYGILRDNNINLQKYYRDHQNDKNNVETQSQYIDELHKENDIVKKNQN